MAGRTIIFPAAPLKVITMIRMMIMKTITKTSMMMTMKMMTTTTTMATEA